MSAQERRTQTIGIPLGIAMALSFALAIRLIPSDWLTDAPTQALLYAAQIPAGMAFVMLFRWLGYRLAVDPFRLLLWTAAASMVFDGAALGFFPRVYGQSGEALTNTAAVLLWAFAWIYLVAMASSRQSDVEPSSSDRSAAAQ